MYVPSSARSYGICLFVCLFIVYVMAGVCVMHAQKMDQSYVMMITQQNSASIPVPVASGSC